MEWCFFVSVLSYVSEFHPRLIGLTGSVENVKNAAKNYRVYYAKTHGSGDDYLVDHSIIMVMQFWKCLTHMIFYRIWYRCITGKSTCISLIGASMTLLYNLWQMIMMPVTSFIQWWDVPIRRLYRTDLSVMAVLWLPPDTCFWTQFQYLSFWINFQTESRKMYPSGGMLVILAGCSTSKLNFKNLFCSEELTNNVLIKSKRIRRCPGVIFQFGNHATFGPWFDNSIWFSTSDQPI